MKNNEKREATMKNEEIRKKIIELADEKYKKFHTGLCPNTNNIIGVRVPILRSLAKEIAKGDINSYLKNANDDYYEEIMLQGMVIGIQKSDFKQTCKYLEKFIPKIENWAICDVTVSELKIVKKNQTEMLNFLKDYLKSEKEFEVRFAVVMLLNYYITEEYIDFVLEQLNEIKHEGYYVKMAVAWAISIAYIKFPKKTIKFLKENNLDNFTYNKALQKIIESYRVDENEKQIIKDMKRK